MSEASRARARRYKLLTGTCRSFSAEEGTWADKKRAELLALREEYKERQFKVMSRVFAKWSGTHFKAVHKDIKKQYEGAEDCCPFGREDWRNSPASKLYCYQRYAEENNLT